MLRRLLPILTGLKNRFIITAVLLFLTSAGAPHDLVRAQETATDPLAAHSVGDSADLAISLFNMRIGALEFSPDGKRLAAIVTSSIADSVKIWSLPSGREILDTANIDIKQSERHLAWHPWKPLLAVNGGGYGDARSGGWVGGLFVLDVNSGKVRDVWYPGNPETSCAWMPDGIHIITADPLLVDVRSGKVMGLVSKLWPYDPPSTNKLVVSLRGDLVRAGVSKSNEQGTSKLEVYRLTGKCYQTFKKVSEFRFVEEQPEGGLVIPIEPSILADGRIVFLRWCRLSLEWKEMDERKDLVETADVQVWVADRSGRNAAYWMTLPQGQTWTNPWDRSEMRFAISRDGRTIAYMRDHILHVRQVDPPGSTSVTTTPGQ